MHKNSMNKVILVGHLGQDPELKSTSTNIHVVNISVATNESFKRKNETEYTDKTEWHRCVAFGKTADYITNYITKGRLVYIDGRLQTRKWTDKDNNTRYSTEVMIETIMMLGKGDGSQQNVSNQSTSNQNTGSDNDQAEDDDLPF
ncbi:MAG: single-stranded DNA-binding protein [Candidatus Marinimicrobia bacterium]|jgi:single-strand DNA-binding protein|nr:single-stranded DNA-binding protein [Candidatus Neomarinimicrobiota bacterium]